MTKENTTARPRRIFRKLAKIAAFGSALIVVMLVIAHFAWKYSGSKKWEFVGEKDGVKVYSLKSPGATRKQFKAVTRIKTTLNRVVAAMRDTSAEACSDWVPGCMSGEVLEQWNPQSQYYVQFFRVEFPHPFSPRDLVVKTQFLQDPQSKAMLVKITALPDKVPQDSCCFRITEMHNSWQYTPLENGEIEVEFLGNYDAGIPYFMYNLGVPQALYDLLSRLEGLINKEKYQHAEFAFVRQP
ncbi:MAG TPA: hypothetical protein VHA33_21330 [Candidatus Angelobacter sp.]|nr:hypothetical protein [Candidatus Angelobacter sp.]